MEWGERGKIWLWNLAAMFEGGISTKISSPQAMEEREREREVRMKIVGVGGREG